MQQGSQLHLALLRRISQQMPASNFRQRFNQSKKRREFFRCNMTQQSNQSDINHSILPLFEHNNNLTPIQKINKKTQSKKKVRQENITISAWSIDDKDQLQPFQETRYNRKLKKVAEEHLPEQVQPVQSKKRRNFSFHSNMSMKKALPELQYIRCPSQDYNSCSSKLKIQKELIPSRCKFNKIKHINLNLDKQNELNALQYMLLKETKIRSVQKISSYHAFVAQMKMLERNRKLRN